MRSFSRTEVPTIFMGRRICVGSTKNLTPMPKFTRATWLQNVYLTVVWSLELETLIIVLPKAVSFNPLLLFLLQNQTYHSCEKGSRLNTQNYLMRSSYSVSRKASFPWISPLLSLFSAFSDSRSAGGTLVLGLVRFISASDSATSPK